ncbi:integrase core domain-containing protein [Streptomyces prasinus]|uniref:integrase core domain-containing protein n=1 Tax=Streptomyces prasinus TaxID=67345 RepID=UPI0033A2DFC2
MILRPATRAVLARAQTPSTASRRSASRRANRRRSVDSSTPPRSRPSRSSALAESFNATCKRETLQGRRAWNTEREAHLDLFRRLHRYNTVRRHSRLGHPSPIAYERALQTTSTTPAEAA